MDHTLIEKISILANHFLLKTAAKKKKKKKKKLDPKAKVRNRGTVVFPAESSKVLDNKDHFPINNVRQARNALARANQYDKSPKWYKGSLKSLVLAVARAVKKKYKKRNFIIRSK